MLVESRVVGVFGWFGDGGLFLEIRYRRDGDLRVVLLVVVFESYAYALEL